MSDIESNLGTMVINEEEDSTMKQYGTAPGHSSYRFTTSIIICFSTMHTAQYLLYRFLPMYRGL